MLKHNKKYLSKIIDDVVTIIGNIINNKYLFYKAYGVFQQGDWWAKEKIKFVVCCVVNEINKSNCTGKISQSAIKTIVGISQFELRCSIMD